MTEEEKQQLMAMMMRQKESQPPPEMGGEMVPLGDQGAPAADYSSYTGKPMKAEGGMSPMQMSQFANAGAVGNGAAGASVSGLPNGIAPVAEGAMYGGYGSAPVAVPAGEGIGAAAGGGSGGGSMLAAAGPWAALAAAIGVNEKQGRDKGRRSKKGGRHLQQALTGEGMSNDLDAVGDRVGGPLGKSMGFMGKMGSPIDATKWAVDKGWKPWEWF